ncbi:MAG: hypothetical protein JJV97_03560 [SAR324 cluster bacterium]|nr:hypothetical protein [SAR324 cluster bacterium]
MKIIISKISFLGVCLFIFASCSSSDKSAPYVPSNIPDKVKMPDWIFSPSIDSGIAAAQCVIFSGNISLDQQEVTAKGRASLAQQVNVRVKVMDKVFQDKTEVDGKVSAGNVFQNVSTQLTDEIIVGSKLIRTDFGEIDKTTYLCGMVAISPEETKKLFDAIVNDAKAPSTNAQDKDILYQEFKAYKAHQELSTALGEAPAK